MEQDHAAFFIDVEKYPSNSILGQARSHFINAVSQRSANGHPDRPAELYRFNVFANPLAVLIQAPKLFSQVRSGSPPAPSEKRPLGLAYLVFSGPPD